MQRAPPRYPPLAGFQFVVASDRTGRPWITLFASWLPSEGDRFKVSHCYDGDAQGEYGEGPSQLRDVCLAERCRLFPSAQRWRASWRSSSESTPPCSSILFLSLGGLAGKMVMNRPPSGREGRGRMCDRRCSLDTLSAPRNSSQGLSWRGVARRSHLERSLIGRTKGGTTTTTVVRTCLL